MSGPEEEIKKFTEELKYHISFDSFSSECFLIWLGSNYIGRKLVGEWKPGRVIGRLPLLELAYLLAIVAGLKSREKRLKEKEQVRAAHQGNEKGKRDDGEMFIAFLGGVFGLGLPGSLYYWGIEKIFKSKR